MQVEDSAFWKTRSNGYNNLSWVSNSSLLDVLYQEIIAYSGKNNLKILDVGTGTAKVLEHIYSYNESHDLWGFDSSREMIDKIENKDRYKIFCFDIELDDINEIANDFDIIISRMVFHHLNNWEADSKKLLSRLKRGGLYLICEGNPPDIQTIPWYEEMFKYKETRRTVSEVDLINLFLGLNLEFVRTRSTLVKNNSLDNWLENSDLDETNKSIVRKMHHESPEYVRQAYNMKEVNGDILMDWKFSVTTGIKL